MTSILLRPRKLFKVPIEASAISPDNFAAARKVEEIKNQVVWEGNRPATLASIFDVEELEQGGELLEIIIEGDASKLRGVGKGMGSGTITVEGNAGIRLGEAMRGGTITVNGNVGSWLGSRMRGGRIEVSGDAGDYVGSAIRGSTRGMSGGQIVVRGSAGNEVGCWMRDGMIRIGGNVGQFAGVHMLGGTIVIEGSSRGRIGASMKGGRIVVLGEVGRVLPSFSIEEIRNVARVGEDRIPGPFYVFAGDLADDGDGRLYVSKDRNLELRFYESYIE